MGKWGKSIAIMVLALCMVLAALPGQASTVHEHNWGAWAVLTPAGCETDGTETRFCLDDLTQEYRPIPATNHNWGPWEVVTPATCTAPGLEARICYNMNCELKNIENREIPQLTEHNWGEWVVRMPAGCETDGVEVRLCLNGDGAEETRPIPATNHNWGAWEVITPATCIAPGLEARACFNANCELKNIENREIPMLTEHTWGEWVVRTPAGCLTDGVEVRLCLVCGAEETRPIPATDHNWGPWEVITPATYTAPGLEARACFNANCELKNIENREIPMLHDHIWSDWAVKTPADCEIDGVESRVCSICQAEETRAIPATGHRWGRWTEVKAPTETRKGETTRICKNNAEHTQTRELPMLTAAEENGWLEYGKVRSAVQQSMTAWDFETVDAVSAACLNIDAANTLTPMDQNVVIYGLSNQAGTLFGDLDQYLDGAWAKANATIQLQLDAMTEAASYEVVAVIKVDAANADDYLTTSFDAAFIDGLTKDSLVDFGAELSADDEFITLVTTDKADDNVRLIVIARKIK